jgi:hypothetical protein
LRVTEHNFSARSPIVPSRSRVRSKLCLHVPSVQSHSRVCESLQSRVCNKSRPSRSSVRVASPIIYQASASIVISLTLYGCTSIRSHCSRHRHIFFVELWPLWLDLKKKQGRERERHQAWKKKAEGAETGETGMEKNARCCFAASLWV